MALRFAFIDMDSFFASCEQQRDPALRGRPVGVIPMEAESTCCIAASYEAKAYGVKTGTNVREARWLCPGIRFVIAGHADYIKVHHAVKAVIQEWFPDCVEKSIDEFCCELPPYWQKESSARETVANFRRALASAIGEHISCSVGLGPNLLLSKIASGMNKPRGLTVIHRHELPGPLAGLDLPDLYGIGKRMHRRLLRHGVRTVNDLYACSRAKLRTIWGGVEGERLHAELRGEIIEHAETVRRQVSHSHILPPHCRNRDDAWAVIHRLTQKAAMRLRGLDHYAGSLALGVRLGFEHRFGLEARFFPTQDTRVFLRALRALWARLPEGGEPPAKVSVVLGALVSEANYTPPLFRELNDPRNVKLDRTMDALNRRFGSRTLYYAGAHRGLREAPMRIAFTHIPDLETEAD